MATEPPAKTPRRKPYDPFASFAAWSKLEFDVTTFDSFASLLEDARNSASPESLTAAVAVATKWAAVDTGAIEGLYAVERGFTFSVALSAAAWDTIHLVKGESVARAINDAVAAYDYVLDAATLQSPMTEYWIKELHATICASQESYTVLTDIGPQERALPKGEYKKEPNSPLNFASNEIHSYAPVIDTVPEMGRLVEELNSREFQDAHPLLQASYAHYGFVCIHPFADGNGRVSRALSSVYLYRNPGVPLVIFADQKNVYIDALESADAGKIGSFVQFMSDRVVDTIGLVRTAMSSQSDLDVGAQVQTITSMLTGRGGLQHTEIDALALRLLETFGNALDTQLVDNPLVAPLHAAVNRSRSNSSQAPENFRNLPNPSLHVQLTIQSDSPANGAANRSYGVAVARPSNHGPDFIVTSNNRILLDVFLREVHPVVSEALNYRTQIAALNEFKEVLAEVAVKAQSSLRAKGYSV